MLLFSLQLSSIFYCSSHLFVCSFIWKYWLSRFSAIYSVCFLKLPNYILFLLCQFFFFILLFILDELYGERRKQFVSSPFLFIYVHTFVYFIFCMFQFADLLSIIIIIIIIVCLSSSKCMLVCSHIAVMFAFIFNTNSTYQKRGRK